MNTFLISIEIIWNIIMEKPEMENIFQHILKQFFCSVGWFRGRGSEAKT